MTEGGGDTRLAAIVEGHHATVGQRQLDDALRLLARNLTRHRAVDLVGQPILAGHGLELQHAADILVNLVCRIRHILIVVHHRLVAHHGLRRMTEHLCHVEVEGFLAVALDEAEVGVACGVTDNIERCTLAGCNLLHAVEVLLVDEQAHALLALVGDNLLGREGLVADGQLGHVNLTAAVLDQLRQAVEVTCRTVVVDGHDGVAVGLDQCAHEVVGAFLHLRVGALHGVELHSRTVAASINRRH